MIVGGAAPTATRRILLRLTAGVSGTRLDDDVAGVAGGALARFLRGAAGVVVRSGGGAGAAEALGRALLGAPMSTSAFRLTPLATGPGGGGAGGASGWAIGIIGSSFFLLGRAAAMALARGGRVAFAAATAMALATGAAFGTGGGAGGRAAGLLVLSRVGSWLGMASSGCTNGVMVGGAAFGGGAGRGGGASPPRQAGRGLDRSLVGRAASVLRFLPLGVTELMSKNCGVAVGMVGRGSFGNGAKIPAGPGGGGGGGREEELPATTGIGCSLGCRITGTPAGMPTGTPMAPAPGGGGGGPEWL